MKKLMNNFLLAIILCIYYPFVACAESSSIPINEAEPQFAKMIEVLKKSTKIRDPFPLIRAVSKNFEIERDFGEVFEKEENAVVNFLSVFPIDGFEVKKEYENVSWNQLDAVLSSNVFIMRSKTNFCMPKGQYTYNVLSDELLCFTKDRFGVWKISSYVYSGD